MPTSWRQRKYSTLVVLTLFFAGTSIAACGGGLRSASGVVLSGDDLLLVGDDSAGTLYRISPGENPALLLHQPFTVSSFSTEAVFGGALASDLEAIAVLPSGEPVVLSEGSAALLARDRVVATYDQSLMQLGGRGLEGLDIFTDGRIAALWEGGYPHPDALPTQFGAGEVSGPFRPAVCVHRAQSGQARQACDGAWGVVGLEVPATPDQAQAFRAPDLVWSADGNSWIVLLASTNAANTEFHYKWLQRFTLAGKPSGPPLNLCDRGQLPSSLRHGAEGNLEGLGWLERGKSLLYVNDSQVKTTVGALVINPWPKTDPLLRCDQAVDVN